MRFQDNNELKYSLRSLEMYAPWINHIFIVTDRQVPKWLNTSYPKVTVIDHSQILPKEMIPTFASDIIESYIGFIPNLSEHFLYSNDDMFFNKPVKPEFFFQQGKPVARLKVDKEIAEIHSLEDFNSEYQRVDTWYKTLMNVWKILYKTHHIFNQYEIHHNIDSFLRSDYLKTFHKYKDYIENNTTRFRSEKNINRIIFNLESVYNGTAILKLLRDPTHWQKKLAPFIKLQIDSLYAEDTPRSLRSIDKLCPYLFCVNSAILGNIYQNKHEALKFYERHFSNPSSFENVL